MGSPVQIRPSRLIVNFFRIHFYPIRASKRAILWCKGPSRGVRRSGATASLQGHVPTRQSRPRPTVKESKITEPPQICTATPTTGEPAGASPRPHRLTASRSLTALQQLHDAGAGLGAQTKPAHTALAATAAGARELHSDEPPRR